MNNKIFKYIKYLSYVLLLLSVGYSYISSSLRCSIRGACDGIPGGYRGQCDGCECHADLCLCGICRRAGTCHHVPLINIISNPKGAMRTLIGVVAMLVIFFVSYLLSSDAPVPNPAANGYFTIRPCLS